MEETNSSATDAFDPLSLLTDAEKVRMSQLVYELRDRTLTCFSSHTQLGIRPLR